jgi:formimidoylglutamate deiminase
VTEELRLLEYNERLGNGKRNILTGSESTCGRFLYQHAAGAGGVASGQPVGILEPGYRADLLELDREHVMMAGRDPDVTLDSWVFAGDRSMINSVWVAGQRRVFQGFHAREEEIRTKFSKVLTGLRDQ